MDSNFSIPTSQEQYDKGAGLTYVDVIPVSAYIKYTADPLIWSVLGDLQGKSILDLACGGGNYLKYMFEKGAKELVGVDISQDMIDASTKKLEGTNCTLVLSDMAKPDLYSSIGENRFDLILCAWGLYNMETDDDLEAALLNTYKMLASNGKACFLLANDIQLLASDIGKEYGIEITGLIKGDWSGVTAVKKILDGSFEIVDIWRSYSVLEEAMKRVGFTKVEKVDTLFDDKGLIGWSPETWQKIKETKPIYIIVASK